MFAVACYHLSPVLKSTSLASIPPSPLLPQCVLHTICLHVFHSHRGLAPDYLSNVCHYACWGISAIFCPGLLLDSTTNTKFYGNCWFSVSGHTARNRLLFAMLDSKIMFYLTSKNVEYCSTQENAVGRRKGCISAVYAGYREGDRHTWGRWGISAYSETWSLIASSTRLS